MALTIVTIAPETFDADVHILPTAGELLLAGATVTINSDGIAFNSTKWDIPDGIVIEVSRKGDVVEIAASGEKQADGGFYFSDICVIQNT